MRLDESEIQVVDPVSIGL